MSRNTQSGEWVCDVFVVKMRGALVDNDRTVTFGHEVLHCVGLPTGLCHERGAAVKTCDRYGSHGVATLGERD